MVKEFLVSALVLMSSFGAVAQTTTTVDATGQGFCVISGCNNLGVGWHSSTAVGSNDQYRNWFSFETGKDSVKSATLRIWNAYGPSIDYSSATEYNIFAATSIGFDSLKGSVSLGSLVPSTVNNGQASFVDLVFNSAGINFLNQHLQQGVIFGGVLLNEPSHLFRYTNGSIKAQLTTVSAVPEPESSMMMIFGLMILAALTKRNSFAVKKSWLLLSSR